MHSFAAWLLLRPWNAIALLAFTLAMPGAPILSGALLVFLVLASGPRQALLRALPAVALVAGLLLVLSRPALPMLFNAAIAWLPAALLAVVMRSTRSLTLAMQVSVLAAVALIAAFFVAVADPVDFWLARIEETIVAFRSMELADIAAVLEARREPLAEQLTMVFVFMRWIVAVLALLLGYALFQRLPEQRGRFGRFSDLNFGRVLAVGMAAASLLSLVINALWVENVAFILFAVFSLQGVAVVHWFHLQGRVPALLVILMYALLPFLNTLLVMVLAVLGYTDAWFNLRARAAAARDKS